jgi:hypothetical protein
VPGAAVAFGKRHPSPLRESLESAHNKECGDGICQLVMVHHIELTNVAIPLLVDKVRHLQTDVCLDC